MKKVLLNHVIIGSFRNIEHQTIEFGEHITKISGKNMIGKTNTLNAIYWCLCGISLNGSNDDSLNCPQGKCGEMCIDVELELTVDGEKHTIARYVDEKEKSFSQHLIIDGVQADTLKNGELLIDKILGLLELSLKDTKNFKVRRFVFNPYYYQTIGPKYLRDYFLSLFEKEDETKVITNSNLSDVSKKNILSGIATYGSFAKYSDAVSKNLKSNKELLGNLKFTMKYVVDNCLVAQTTKIEEDIKVCNQNAFKYEENNAFIKEAGPVISKASVVNFATNCNLNLVFFEKGLGEDVWYEVCYPQLNQDSDLNIAQGSKSELIRVNALFLTCFAQEILKSYFPILIDDGESVDSLWFDDLATLGSQVIITCVSNHDLLVEAK